MNLVRELDAVLELNQENNVCSEKLYSYITYTINGLENSYNLASLSLITYTIPNLFRNCFYQHHIQLPSACPSYINSAGTYNYFPMILNKSIIKSFLYFNFPSSYTKYNQLNTYISKITNTKELQIKKRNKTYASYTPSNNIIASTYSTDSLFIQILAFNNYLKNSAFSVSNSTILNTFQIIWDILPGCIQSSQTNAIYTLTNTLPITNAQGNALYTIQTNSLSLSKFTNPNIFYIIDYALEVYEDILLDYQYYLTNGVYCPKEYMNTINIKYLTQLYSIYYKNQIYINQQNLVTTNVLNVVPTTITIESYITQFIAIQANSQGLRLTYLKNVILSIYNAFVFYWNVPPYIIPTSYTYYYINIYNPSPNVLSNSWNAPIDYSISGINSFIQDFIYGVTYQTIYYQGYLSLTGTTEYIYTPYNGGGLYPDEGLDYTSPMNIGYLYYFYNTSKTIRSYVYLTLLTVNADGNPNIFAAVGCSLVITDYNQ